MAVDPDVCRIMPALWPGNEGMDVDLFSGSDCFFWCPGDKLESYAMHFMLKVLAADMAHAVLSSVKTSFMSLSFNIGMISASVRLWLRGTQ